MKQVKRVIDRVFIVTNALCRILLCMVFGLMWIVVFGRYFFGYTPVWSEDIILLSLCWLVMLSGADGFRTDAHLKITVFQDMLPESARNCLRIILDIFTALFFAWLMKYAVEQVITNVTVFYTGCKISKMWVFLCFPISFTLIILAKVDKYITICQKKESEVRA